MYFYDTETTVNALDFELVGEYILDLKKLKSKNGRFHDLKFITPTEPVFGKTPKLATNFKTCNYHVATLKEILKTGTSVSTGTNRSLHNRMLEMCSPRYTLTSAGNILTDELTKMVIAVHLHNGNRVFLFAKECSNPLATENHFITTGLKAEGYRPIANRCNR
jgi:hypothetical protein